MSLIRMLVGDSILEDLALGRLGIAKVYHLVHEFVYDDKVVSYRLFLELFDGTWVIR